MLGLLLTHQATLSGNPINSIFQEILWQVKEIQPQRVWKYAAGQRIGGRDGTEGYRPPLEASSGDKGRTRGYAWPPPFAFLIQHTLNVSGKDTENKLEKYYLAVLKNNILCFQILTS